ncbi:hypothetical protein DIPPA_06963 [Diplonema papillatum]|nr:hypothetical protein DIPPA_09215 [Diplonema papillatum]KAJ9442242.1 hypothetical protein DIPPA_16210 [Diplonema papillatum]KAJ9442261.1 hypothetical protein DIPPA_28654 [Diplonema papillatum]KAJ9446626.1 hypothetical protein DIPPA_10755 [Diplonema papillatum]KAJ9462273.1 hypothetical protein DIPPA_09820 [Diplonema papillatum]
MPSDGEVLLIGDDELHAALEKVYSLCGEVSEVKKVMESIGQVARVSKVRSAGGYYKGNVVKLLEMEGECDLLQLTRAAAEHRFSINPAAWIITPPQGIELEAFQRRTARDDPFSNPPSDLIEAMEKVGMKASILRYSATGYRVYADRESEGLIGAFAERLDAAGIAVKRDGVFVKSKEQAARDREAYRERQREEYGVVGLSRTLADYEVQLALNHAGVTADVELVPAYGLTRTTTTFVVKGLDDEEEALLQSLQIKIGGRDIRFGRLGVMVGAGAESVQSPGTYAQAASRSEASSAGEEADEGLLGGKGQESRPLEVNGKSNDKAASKGRGAGKMGKGEKAKGGGRSAAVEYTVGAKRSLAREGEGSLSPPAKSKPGERGGEGGMETSPPGTPRPRVDPEDGSY